MGKINDVNTDTNYIPLIIPNTRYESTSPKQYRLAIKNKGLMLQGLFEWWDGMSGGMEWRMIPIILLDENDNEIMESKDGG